MFVRGVLRVVNVLNVTFLDFWWGFEELNVNIFDVITGITGRLHAKLKPTRDPTQYLRG